MSHSSFQPRVLVFDTAAELCDAARRIIVADATTGARTSHVQPTSIALSGGSTPRRLYESIHSQHYDLACKQRAFMFVMGDERLVPPDDALANYRMAYEALLRDVPHECVLAPDTAPAVPTATDTAAGKDGACVVAEKYEAALLQRLPTQTVTTDEGTTLRIPSLDIVLLGFGADGHTASIFPHSIAACDGEHSVSVSFPSETMHPKVWRVTLTQPVIQHAAHVVVLAAGKDKNWVVRGILDDKVDGELPVSRFLRSCKHRVTFLLDTAAAQGVVHE